MKTMRIIGLRRRWALLLVLCALAMRMVVPQGFMWAADSGGVARIVICSGTMPAAMPGLNATRPHDDQRDHGGQEADHPCAFAAAASLDLASDPPRAIPHAPRADAPVALHLFARPGLGLAAPPPPKTGPPAFA